MHTHTCARARAHTHTHTRAHTHTHTHTLTRTHTKTPTAFPSSPVYTKNKQTNKQKAPTVRLPIRLRKIPVSATTLKRSERIIREILVLVSKALRLFSHTSFKLVHFRGQFPFLANLPSISAHSVPLRLRSSHNGRSSAQSLALLSG